MNAEILAIGTEILLGDIVNTNAQFLSRELSALGINVFYHSVCGDNPSRIESSLKLALTRSDIVITTGGLGPTYDDITKECVAELFGRKMVLDEEALANVKERFAGRTMTENNLRQAYMPEGATVFTNDWGTAPACAVENDEKCVIMLPGPPREMTGIFGKYVVPFLSKYADGIIVSYQVRTFGIGESALEDMLADLLKSSTNPTIAPYAKEGECLLRVTAKAASKEECERLIAPVLVQIEEKLGDNIYGIDVDSLQEAVVAMLKKNGLKLASAESCTGGLFAERMTETPGSSSVFECGVVAYSAGIKERVLSVSPELISEVGTVSAETAEEMANGVLHVSGADIAIAITGVAGPDTFEGKPVGTVHFAVCDRAGNLRRKEILANRSTWNRRNIRHYAVLNALDEIRRFIIDTVNPPKDR